MEEFKVTGAPNQVYEIFEDLLEKECEKLKDFFLTRLQETKEKILKNFKDSPVTMDNKIKEFLKQFKTVYNVDSLNNIINSWQTSKKGFAVVNQELDLFFKDVNCMKTQEMELRKLSKELNSSLKNYLVIEEISFENFKKSIPFEIIETYPPQKEVSPFSNELWAWNISKKSKTITLKENNMRATKESGANGEYSAVVGSLPMSKGCYEWKLEIKTFSANRSWICFGIIEEGLVSNFEDFPFEKGFGFSTYRQPYQMTVVDAIPEYDNKTFTCQLDLDNGTFAILHHDTVICQQTNNIMNKIFIPFVCLNTRSNTVKLQPISSDFLGV